MITLLTPENGAVVSLATDVQKLFRSPEETKKRKEMDGALTFHWYALEKTDGDRSRPQPVHIAWQDEDEPDLSEDLRGGSYFVIVSRHRDLSNPTVVATDETEADVWNLQIGKRYYFCVQKEGHRSEVRYFDTEKLWPRCLYIDGTSNVRDIGGRRVGKKTVKQGLFYRGGEIERHMHITEKGIRQMQQLGIKTDLDLRGEVIGRLEHHLLPLYGIKHLAMPIGPYQSILLEENRKTWRDIFRMMTHAENYPIYYHCWGGADRGGTLAFLVGALLGFTEEQLDLDYEYTGLSIWGLRSQNYEPYVEMKNMLKAYPGKTLAEKTERYMKKHLGLTALEIQKIRKIFLG